jgi:hypothetical protein
VRLAKEKVLAARQPALLPKTGFPAQASLIEQACLGKTAAKKESESNPFLRKEKKAKSSAKTKTGRLSLAKT